MSHGAQCLLCQHAKRGTREVSTKNLDTGRWRGKTIPFASGCDRFNVVGADEPNQQIRELQDMVAALLYTNAASHSCPGFQKIELHQDGYFAKDAPR